MMKAPEGAIVKRQKASSAPDVFPRIPDFEYILKSLAHPNPLY